MKVRACVEKNNYASNRLKLEQWLATNTGQRLLGCERELLQEQLERYFGSYAVLYDPVENPPFRTDVRNQISLGCAAQDTQIKCAEAYWPIQPESIDVVVLQHSLEFAASPYDLLRQAALAVRPGGHLVIVGINPFSGFAAASMLLANPWRKTRLLSSRRLVEWLTLLGFKLEVRRFSCYSPLTWNSNKLNKLELFLSHRQWPIGSCYILAARKMMQAPLARRQSKLKLDKLVPLSGVTTSVRRPSCVDKNTIDD